MVKRVAVMVEQFWHRVPGGTARATFETLKALSAIPGFDLVGIAATHRRSSEPAYDASIPIKYARLPRPVLYDSWHRLGFPSVEQITGPVDMVWASAMVVPPPSVPIVTTVHDLDFLIHPERLSRRGASFFPQAWEATKARSTLIVCPSETVAEACVERGVTEDQVRVIPWGVTCQPCDDMSVLRVRERFNLPERFVLWVGTMEPRKNLPGLVRAMESVADLPLVIAGPDGWVLDSEGVLEPLGDRAIRVGRVDDEELRGLYAAASVFVMPSFAEGFGLPVLEAMAQGTPVITSRGTATEEVACDAAILVDPRDPDELTRAIQRVLDEDGLAGSLSEQGIGQARKCSWKSTGAQYGAVFAEAMEIGCR